MTVLPPPRDPGAPVPELVVELARRLGVPTYAARSWGARGLLHVWADAGDGAARLDLVEGP